MNNYLNQFPVPGTGITADKLPQDKLLDLLEFGIPLQWQSQMRLQAFEPYTKTVREFVKFCERLEAVFPVGENKKPAGNEQDRKPEDRTNGRKRRRDNKNSGKDGYWCLLHGKNSLHDTNDCKALKADAKKRLNAKTGKDNNGKNKNVRFATTDEEIHTLVEYVKRNMAKDVAKTEAELHNFESLSVSDDGESA